MKAENIYNATAVTGCCFTFWIPGQSASTGSPRTRSDQQGLQVTP